MSRKVVKNEYIRTRRDHATEVAEDYVEAIEEIQSETGTCRVVDLARRFGVTHVTVNKTVGRLQRDGFVDTEPYAPVALTRKGKKLASQSSRRHEIVLSFLLALGVSEETAKMDAEGIEHHVSEETLLIMQAFSSQDAGCSTAK